MMSYNVSKDDFNWSPGIPNNYKIYQFSLAANCTNSTNIVQGQSLPYLTLMEEVRTDILTAPPVAMCI